jgi:NADH-quinone oxidoreductase subunit A
MTDLVLFVVIFLVAGGAVLGGHLFLGRLVRPHKPDAEKGTVYECGEPTIGSAWIQFDLRFYVVALLFVIFDVELAFFFPWAVVFGSANRAADISIPEVQRLEAAQVLQPSWKEPAPAYLNDAAKAETHRLDPEGMNKLAWVAFVDIMIFFAVLLVGFAYLWRRGDLNWVRSTAAQDLAANPAIE